MISSKLFLALLSGCVLLAVNARAIDPAKDPAKLRAWMAHFKAQDPVAEATKNHQKGTTYVMGAMGVGAYYPGIGYEQGERVKKAHSVKYLPATSDAVESDLHRKYMEVAVAYASKYNQTTLKLLGIPNESKK